jgi:ABC-2 type transport system ATP-binding protein
MAIVHRQARHQIIKIANLFKTYQNGVKANVAISFEVYEGETFGVVGPNGAGKTTLLRQMTGELLPSSGKIEINGIDVIARPLEIKKIAGICPQEIFPFGHLKVWEHIYFLTRLKGVSKSDATKKADIVLKALRLDTYRDRVIDELSGGLKRKLVTASALSNRPKLLFLDEPTTGLDPESRRSVWNVIKQMTKEDHATVVLTTHYMEEAEHLCDRIAIINKGRIIEVGSPTELKSKLRYNLKIKINPHVAKKIELILSKIDHNMSVSEGYLEICLRRKDAKESGLIDMLLDVSEAEVVLGQPTLEDFYLEAMENG